MVLQEAGRCSWLSCRWVLVRRRHLPSYDYPSAPRSRLWLDVAYLRIPNIGIAQLRKPNGPLPDTTNAAPIQRIGICPSPQSTQFLAFDGSSLLFLLLVKLCPNSLHQLIIIGGMFIPFTFIVVEAQSHGMSSRLANYLVPILNAARSVS